MILKIILNDTKEFPPLSIERMVHEKPPLLEIEDRPWPKAGVYFFVLQSKLCMKTLLNIKQGMLLHPPSFGGREVLYGNQTHS